MTAALELRNVTARAGDRVLLHKISLRLQKGEFIALIGPNGAGKSVLMRTALGLMTPSQGEVLLDGKSTRKMAFRKRAACVAWLPQEALPREPLTILDVVSAARFRFNEPISESRRSARVALAQTGVEPLAERFLSTLSGGERQRVALAATLAQEAPLLCLDEPANHLDPAQQVAIYQLIGRLWQNGHGILCITHDINLLAHVAPHSVGRACRIIGLSQGRIRFHSRLDADRLSDQMSQLFQIAFKRVHMDEHSYFVLAAETPVS